MRVSQPWVRFVVFSSICGAAPLTAGAQVAPAAVGAASQAGEPAGYRSVVEEAKREHDRGNFVEARALFNKANAIFPNARVLRGLGMTLFELKNYAESASKLEEALASNVRPLEGELRAETVSLLERTHSFVARLKVVVEPGSALVIVDGVPTKLGPQGNIVLEFGPHALEFRAAGYAVEKRVIKVIGGEEESLRVVLPPEGSANAPILTPVASSPERKDEPRRPLYKNPWLWTGVGVAVAAAATGLALGLSRGGGTQDPPVTGAWDETKIR
jgi:hypothetical protein